MFRLVSHFLLITSLPILFTISWYGGFDKPLTQLLEYYFTTQDVTIHIDNLEIHHGQIKIDKIHYHTKVGEILASDLNFKINLNKLHKALIAIDGDIGEVAFVQNNQSLVKFDTQIQYATKLFTNKYNLQLNIKNITGTEFSSYSNTIKALLNINVDRTDKYIKFFMNLADNGKLFANGTLDKHHKKYDLEIINVPFSFYKVARYFIPHDGILEFLDEHIKGGNIVQAKLNLELPKHINISSITSQNINGTFKVDNLEYNYHKQFLPIKNGEVNVELLGTKVNILINKALLGNSKIFDGLVSFDWGNSDPIVITDAKARGSIIDLMNFVEQDIHSQLAKNKIDLNTIDGQAQTNIHIEIPIQANKPNKYLITNEATDIKFKLFDGQVKVNNGKLRCKFDGEQFSCNGDIIFNNYPSNISFIHKFILPKENKDIKTFLQLKTNIKALTFTDLIQITNGHAVADITYQQQDNEHKLKLASNLTNLEFRIENLLFYKEQKEEANLEVTKLLNEPTSPINFKMLGNSNLKIIGNFYQNGTNYKLLIPTLQYVDNHLTCQITSNNNMMTVQIGGEKLDLSMMNMNLFNKSSNTESVVYDINIANVKLKNNIWLDDVKWQLNCNKYLCSKGNLIATIGQDFIKLSLHDIHKQIWQLNTSNVGLLAKGLGISNKVQKGEMELSFKKENNDIAKYNGNFTIKNMVIDKTPFLTRLVSLISLPGFLKLFSNNNNVSFTEVSGKIIYYNNNIHLQQISALGSQFDLAMNSIITVNPTKQNVNVKAKGLIVPSIYGINNLIKNVPIIGNLFSGRRKGLLSAPFYRNDTYPY